MLAFVEAGTEQAADLGYGDDSYFNALETKLKEIARLFDELPASARGKTVSRLRQVRDRGKDIGWGYGDFLDDLVTGIERRAR
jgi:hypothetical protein